MLSLEKRLELFEECLNSMSNEELYKELQSYEPLGPLAEDFLNFNKLSSNCNSETIGKPYVVGVTYVGGLIAFDYSSIANQDNVFSVSCNDEIYSVSLAS